MRRASIVTFVALTGCFNPAPSVTSVAASDETANATESGEGTTDDDAEGTTPISMTSTPSDTNTPTTSITDASTDDGVPASCTDGAFNGDETDQDCGGTCPPCDDGLNCGAPEDCASGVCSGGTCAAPTCGDGVQQMGEACDDGGPSAECTSMCTFVSCGDGRVSGGEDCDDAGESAECNVDCTFAACGDEQINASAGEECDEAVETAACDDDCTLVSCGDGNFNASAGEECDDGGESAGCDVDCTESGCGDGTVNASAGEDCEGGSPDICAPGCVYTGCGPDPVALAMSACMAAFPHCEAQDGGIVGYDDTSCTGCNCGDGSTPWRWYCTETSDDTNWNCSPCNVGQILAPHSPCQCGAGTSQWLDSFCFI